MGNEVQQRVMLDNFANGSRAGQAEIALSVLQPHIDEVKKIGYEIDISDFEIIDGDLYLGRADPEDWITAHRMD